MGHEKNRQGRGFEQRELSSREIQNGFQTKPLTDYKLIIPAFEFELAFDFDTIKDDTYTLCSTDADRFYKKTVVVKDDAVKKDGKIVIYFQGIDPEKRYTLEVEPGPDRDGKKQEKRVVFENIGYAENKEIKQVKHENK